MTAQFREVLFYKGERMGMAEEPLKPFLSMREDIQFASNCTACWRGYIGNWEIKDNKLYLVELKFGFNVDETLEMNDLFPGQSEVFAEWYSGEIRVPTGERLEYVHMGYASIYEKDIFLVFINGKLVNEYEVDNREAYNKRKEEVAIQDKKSSSPQKTWWKRLLSIG